MPPLFLHQSLSVRFSLLIPFPLNHSSSPLSSVSPSSFPLSFLNDTVDVYGDKGAGRSEEKLLTAAVDVYPSTPTTPRATELFTFLLDLVWFVRFTITFFLQSPSLGAHLIIPAFLSLLSVQLALPYPFSSTSLSLLCLSAAPPHPFLRPRPCPVPVPVLTHPEHSI